MKTIEEIESMSFEDLERIAANDVVKAPEHLKQGIENAVLASAMRNGRKPARKAWYAASAAFAAVAAAAAIVLTVPSRPKDTFSDPLLAYAEVERTLNYISMKMDKGLDMVGEVEPALEKPAQIINKLNQN